VLAKSSRIQSGRAPAVLSIKSRAILPHAIVSGLHNTCGGWPIRFRLREH